MTTLFIPLLILLITHGVLRIPLLESQGTVIFLFFIWITSSQAILTLTRLRQVASWKVSAAMLMTLLFIVFVYLFAVESFTEFLYPESRGSGLLLQGGRSSRLALRPHDCHSHDPDRRELVLPLHERTWHDRTDAGLDRRSADTPVSALHEPALCRRTLRADRARPSCAWSINSTNGSGAGRDDGRRANPMAARRHPLVRSGGQPALPVEPRAVEALRGHMGRDQPRLGCGVRGPDR